MSITNFTTHLAELKQRETQLLSLVDQINTKIVEGNISHELEKKDTVNSINHSEIISDELDFNLTLPITEISGDLETEDINLVLKEIFKL